MTSRICSVGEAARAWLRWLLPSWRALRLSTYLSCVSLLLLLSVGRALYAATREDAFSVGHDLLGLSDLTGGAETVTFNGERFHHAVTATAQPLRTVLDRIEAHCRTNPGPAALLLDQLSSRDPKRFERQAPPGALRNAVFREEVATRGMVLCFVAGPNPVSVSGWLESLRRFSTTRDLSSFGRLRYSFAETVPNEGTRVVTLWADTGLDLCALFPKVGDAPGVDSRVMPRPPNARRTVAASAEGLPLSVHVYESNQALADAQGFYDTWAREHGYRAAHDRSSGSSSYASPSGSQAFLSLLRSNEHTFVTLTESEQLDAAATLELGAQP